MSSRAEGGRVRYSVRFADETRKEFRKIGHTGRADILSAIQKKLTSNPDEYGEDLGQDLVGFRKLPVGQWRVVYHVDADEVLVLVLAVGKRAEGGHENIYNRISRTDLTSRMTTIRRQVAAEKRGKKKGGKGRSGR